MSHYKSATVFSYSHTLKPSKYKPFGTLNKKGKFENNDGREKKNCEIASHDQKT